MVSLSTFKIKHKIWFFSFLIINFFIGCLAIVTNPYRLLPVSITIKGINDIKPKLYDYQRYVKLFDMAQQKPKTVLLGSSRILWGVDPQNPVLQQPGYTPVYNGGVLGPPMYEIRKYFDHALVSQPHLKRVIMGIDFYAFNQAFDGRTFLLETSFNKNEAQLLRIHYKLIYDLKAMFLTLKSSIFRKYDKSLREDGRLTPAPLEAREIYKDFFHPETQKKVEMPQIKSEGNKEGNDKQGKPREMKNVLYGDFKISKIDMDALRYIIETCKKRNIELLLFVTPPYSHPQYGGEIEAFHSLGIWNEYKYFLKQLALMHSYWSFVGWNEVTTNRDNYVDGSHFVFSVGDMILKRIFHVDDSSIPKTFGRYVTAQSVDRYINRLEIEYDKVHKQT